MTEADYSVREVVESKGSCISLERYPSKKKNPGLPANSGRMMIRVGLYTLLVL